MAIFFTADQHFYHQGSLKWPTRPFETVEEMNDYAVKKWNQTVTLQDTVYVLGDFCWKPQFFRDILERLNFRELYILEGNHDNMSKYLSTCLADFDPESCIELCNTDKKIYLKYGLGFTLRYNNILFTLSHYPLLTWDRAQYNLPGKICSVQLFGHVHGNLPEAILHPCQMDVGVDCHDFKPLKIEDIIKLMNEKTWL